MGAPVLPGLAAPDQFGIRGVVVDVEGFASHLRNK
jgi:hypothetical protein